MVRGCRSGLAVRVRGGVAAGLLLVLALTALQLPAADKDGKFAALGAGVASCSRFLEAREARSSEYFLFGGWIDGYLSAQNQTATETYSLVPWQSVDLLASSLADYCRTHPEEPFLRAVTSMAAALRPQRLEVSSERISVTVGQLKQDFFRETLRRMQMRLAELGYFKGEVNGDFGKDSAAALGAFQRDQNIAISGFPDQLTLFRLFY